jgi:hypothetical protein
MPPDEEQFRAALRDVLARSGLSMRALSAAMGRDPGTSLLFWIPRARHGHARRRPIY